MGRRLPHHRPFRSQVLTPRDQMFTGEVNKIIMHNNSKNASQIQNKTYRAKIEEMSHGSTNGSTAIPPTRYRLAPAADCTKIL